MSIDLGKERLLISTHFGDEFTRAIENEDPTEREAVAVAREHLALPGKRLIGGQIKPESGLRGLMNSLIQEMGLPPSSNSQDLKSRLTGRETDFLVVVLGNNSLPQFDRIRLGIQLKALGIRSIVED